MGIHTAAWRGGFISQKSWQALIPPHAPPTSISLCWHLWSPGGHTSLPHWKEEGWIFFYFYNLVSAHPKVEITLHLGQTQEAYSRHRDTNIIIWDIPVKQTSTLASYLPHRLPVNSQANDTPASQDQGAGLSQMPVSPDSCLTVL